MGEAKPDGSGQQKYEAGDAQDGRRPPGKEHLLRIYRTAAVLLAGASLLGVAMIRAKMVSVSGPLTAEQSWSLAFTVCFLAMSVASAIALHVACVQSRRVNALEKRVAELEKRDNCNYQENNNSYC